MYGIRYSGPTKRVISWSSLDWDRKRWNQIDLVLGTLFDAGVHGMNAWFLMELLPPEKMHLGWVLTAFYTLAILCNPILAWSSFKSQKTPEWIKKKLKPLTADDRQEIKMLESLGNMGD